MKTFIVGIIAIMAITLLIACSRYQFQHVQLNKLQLDMTKTEVEQTLEMPPYNVIGSKRFPNGIVEVWEYRRHERMYGNVDEIYWLYFLNGKLDRWGRPGDWSKEADQVYEFRFK